MILHTIRNRQQQSKKRKVKLQKLWNDGNRAMKRVAALVQTSAPENSVGSENSNHAGGSLDDP
jgi:hypothetical protein